jgi:quercetin dioxygenase-like cupin family protein
MIEKDGVIHAASKFNFVYASANVAIYHVNKNEGLTKHSHAYSHATMCHAGSCLVSLEGRSYTLTKDSQPLDLPAGEWHEIKALEDGTVFVNIFAEGKY